MDSDFTHIRALWQGSWEVHENGMKYVITFRNNNGRIVGSGRWKHVQGYSHFTCRVISISETSIAYEQNFGRSHSIVNLVRDTSSGLVKGKIETYSSSSEGEITLKKLTNEVQE